MGATALERQQRRLRRLLETGVGRATVFVHEECRLALEALRPYLVEARHVNLLQSIVAHVNKEAAKKRQRRVKTKDHSTECSDIQGERVG
jgi:DNA adenine methylase